MTLFKRVSGCGDCPFDIGEWSVCDHPDAPHEPGGSPTLRTTLFVDPPAECPLRKSVIVISLELKP